MCRVNELVLIQNDSWNFNTSSASPNIKFCIFMTCIVSFRSLNGTDDDDIIRLNQGTSDIAQCPHSSRVVTNYNWHVTDYWSRVILEANRFSHSQDIFRILCPTSSVHNSCPSPHAPSPKLASPRNYYLSCSLIFPVAGRSKAYVCCCWLSIAGIAGSNSTEGVDVCYVCCVGSGLSDELITHLCLIQ